MAKFIWCNGNVPNNMQIKQVYGILFSTDGRIFVMAERLADRIKYCLPGGHPEDIDKTLEDTLRREVLEEVNISVKNPIIVGYQEVNEEDGSCLYAQVRMAALIDKVGEKTPDIANGKTYDRLLVSPSKAIELLNWGEVGYLQIMSAVEIVEAKYSIKLSVDTEKYI